MEQKLEKFPFKDLQMLDMIKARRKAAEIVRKKTKAKSKHKRNENNPDSTSNRNLSQRFARRASVGKTL